MKKKKKTLKIIKRIKEHFSYKTKYKEQMEENQKLLEEIGVKDVRIEELEFELDKDEQAQKIEYQKHRIEELIKAKKINRNDFLKERDKRIELEKKLKEV